MQFKSGFFTFSVIIGNKMFRIRIFQVFLNRNIYFNRISCLNLPKGFFVRNLCAAGSVSENIEIHPFRENPHFRKYIEENAKFKYPVTEILKLNFAPDKYECLKLLFQLKENKDDTSLWREMLDCLIKEMKDFDLEDFLKAIALAGSIAKYSKKHKFLVNFISSVDNEIRNRHFQLDELLEILFVVKHTEYLNKSVTHFRFYLKLIRHCWKLHKLQPFQITHLFYYFNKFNDDMRRYYKFPIRMYFKENWSIFNTEETGIIMSALTRTKVIHADMEFVKKVINKVLADIDNVQSTHLHCVCKFLEYNANPAYSKAVLDFQEQLVPHLSRFNEASLVSALYSNHLHCVNLSLWEKSLERFMLAMDKLSFFNLARIASITTSHKVNAEEFLKLAAEEAQRRDIYSFENYEHIISFCKHLALHKIFPKKLLDVIFSEDFINEMLKRSFFGEIRDWLFLNYTFQIDQPEYQCRNLDETTNKKLILKVFYHQPDEKFHISHFKARLYLLRTLITIYGEDKVIQRSILPHFEWGIVMRFDTNLNALPIPEEFINHSEKTIQNPVDDQIWVCVNMSVLSPEGLSLLQETYVRHLSAAGFTSILIDMVEFFKTRSKRHKKYLEGKIEEKLKELSQHSETKSCS